MITDGGYNTEQDGQRTVKLEIRKGPLTQGNHPVQPRPKTEEHAMPTPTKTSGERTRSVQVGFLMKAYRESAPGKDGRKGVSQGELLSRMASVDPEHHKANSHSIVSRWESGETVPTVRRLETFGAALGLPEEEVEGLILLAGLSPDYQDGRTLTCPRCGGETQTERIRMTRRTDEAPGVTAATRTRKCLDCGHTAESCERWLDSAEEAAHREMRELISKMKWAGNQIAQAVERAEEIQRTGDAG